MALLKATNYRGIDLPDAYHRIGALRFDAPSRVYVRVDTYASKSAAEAGEPYVSSADIGTDLDGCGATKATLNIKKAYAAVKAREEFTDATDDV